MVDTFLDGVSQVTVSFIESRKQYGSEVHRPDPIVDGFEPQTFAREYFADEDELATPAHAAVGTHLRSAEMSRVNDLGNTLGVGARGGTIVRRGDFAVERPVRPLLVEVPAA